MEGVSEKFNESIDKGENEGKERRSGRYSFRKRKSENKYDSSFLGRRALCSGSDTDSEGDERLNSKGQPSTLVESMDGVSGSDVFMFKTPKKRGQMYDRAVESAKKCGAATCLSPVQRHHVGNGNKRSSKTTSKTPSKKEEPATPHNVRVKTRRQLAKRAELTISSDEMETSEESEASTDEEKLGEDSDENEEILNGPTTGNMIEEYFLAHGSAKISTSDHTLASLNQPKINQENLQEKLKNLSKSHATYISSLMQRYQSNFKKWLYLIDNGYNILLFGLGSKHDILDNFRVRHLSQSDCIVINGYFPDITIRQVLNTICGDVMDSSSGLSSISEQLNFIKSNYDATSDGEHKSKEKLYILIHSIDGATLRRNEDQHVLSVLASFANIHILASVDHINCSLMWDQTKSHLFSWLWFDVTNFEPYSKETSYENSLLVQHSGQLALSSLSHVFRSLTPNAQGMFMLLAEYQLENKETSLNYIGLSFQDYYQKCREAFLVNSDLTLRAQLTEFRDHKLIKMKKAVDGVEHLNIPLDNSTLMEFIKNQEK